MSFHWLTWCSCAVCLCSSDWLFFSSTSLWYYIHCVLKLDFNACMTAMERIPENDLLLKICLLPHIMVIIQLVCFGFFLYFSCSISSLYWLLSQYWEIVSLILLKKIINSTLFALFTELHTLWPDYVACLLWVTYSVMICSWLGLISSVFAKISIKAYPRSA